MVITKYDNFPYWIVLLSNIVTLIIYGLGIFILVNLNWIAAVLFVGYILVLEIRLLKYHCVNCFYWGKTCGFGKGKLSALIYKKGDPTKFCIADMSWKDMIPDLLISLIPLITGVMLMIIKFNFYLLISVVLLVLLSTVGNGYIRGNLACKHCKQKDLGCPAEQLFNKK